MALERIQYTSTPLSKSIGLTDLIFFVAAPTTAGWLMTRDEGNAALYGLCGFLILALGRSITRYISSRKSFSEAKGHLQKQGFKTDMEFGTCFAIDSVAGKIAFVEPLSMSYDLYEISDILGCEHQWKNKSSSNGLVTKEKNVLVFKTRNPHKPLYKFNVFGHETAELWLAKISALLNR